MRVEIREGSILEVDTDVIVNPANSLGIMGGGVAGVIRRQGGEEIEKEAMMKAPIPIGKAILTTSGKLSFKGVIHSPTMEQPAVKTSVEEVKKAVKAALELADELCFKSIAFPGMGTGVGGLNKEVAARAMIEEIRNFKSSSLERVVLVDVDEEMIKAWRSAL